ncbi:hypothetical protein Bca4012_021751 [Brassica carinata]
MSAAGYQISLSVVFWKLTLVWRQFEDQDLCDVLLPGCPVLDELTVVHKYDFYPYRISSQTIKKLTVYYDCESGIDGWSDMSFDPPSLVSLDYTDYAMFKYPLVNFESLVKAKLNLFPSGIIKNPDLSGLIIGISNVQTLHLSPASADVIARCVEEGLVLPVFKNLVSLTFGSYNERGWKLLLDLLKQSPKLKALNVQGLEGNAGDVRIHPFQVKVEELIHHAAKARRSMEKEKKMFVLKSSDDVSFEVDEAVVLQSQILSHLVEDCTAPEYKIKEVTGKILAKVFEYCKNHVLVVDGGDSSSSSGDALKKWDAEFIMEMDLSTVFDLLTAASYLDIKGLFDLTCQRVADEIAACRDYKEIRAKLGIESDYTAEEEAEVIKENQWAFD